MKTRQSTNTPPPILELIPEEWMPQPGPWISTVLDPTRAAPKVRELYPDLEIGYYPHHHQFLELEIVQRGTGIHHIAGQDYPVSAGDIYAVPPGTVHYFTKLSDDFRHVDILFMPELVPLPMKQLRQLPGFNMLVFIEPTHGYPGSFKSRMRLAPPQFARFNEMYNELTRELLKRPVGYEAQSVALLTQILVLLGRNYSLNESDEEGTGMLPGISDALNLIARAYSRTITLPELAAAAHMSLRPFQRNFLLVMKMHVTEYIRKIRMEHAAEMLRHTRQDVLGIAMACGFQDAIYFCQSFRRHFGCSPLQYRKREQGL